VWSLRGKNRLSVKSTRINDHKSIDSGCLVIGAYCFKIVDVSKIVVD